MAKAKFADEQIKGVADPTAIAKGNGNVDVAVFKGQKKGDPKAFEINEFGDVKVKKFLNSVLQETLEPIRLRRKELENNKEEILAMLFKGSDEAKEVAAQNLIALKNAMGINYRG